MIFGGIPLKIIHTGDWHIGKIVNEFHMTADQEYILEQFIEIIREEKPDAVVIAGDIYDRSVAPVEAVELLDRVFTKIVIDLKTPILAVAGNHDSPERLGFACEILRNKGLYIEGLFKKNISKVELSDEHGPVNFYLLPYADPAFVRDVYEDENIRSHDDAFKAVLEKIGGQIKSKERNILITHGYVRGVEDIELSDSERPLSIGGTDYVNVEHFNRFHYTALGHLHGPQKVGSERVRYSGSLMKYSFSEVRQKKSITIVNLDEKGNITTELRGLVPLRDMRVIKGELKNLLDPVVYMDTNIDDYINVILTDEGELIDPIGKLRAVYKNVMQITRENRQGQGKLAETEYGMDYRNKSKVELFKDFYQHITDVELGEDKVGIIENIIEEIEKGER